MIEENKADENKMTYVRGTRKSNEWYTPTRYIDLVRKSFYSNTIELDAFSSDKANTIVKAVTYLTEEDDAFTTDWGYHANCFINPPYSAGLCLRSVNTFIDYYLNQRFDEGIILVNNATETKWFQRMLKVGSAMCLPNHRISYWNDDFKKISGNPRGQAFMFFGANTGRFRANMSEIGTVMILR